MKSKNKKLVIVVVVVIVIVLLCVVALRPKSPATAPSSPEQQSSTTQQQSAATNTPQATTSKNQPTTPSSKGTASSSAVAKSFPPTVTTLTVGTIFSGGCGTAPCQNPLAASAVLNGNFSANGSGTATWFEYWDQTTGGAIKTTEKVKQNGSQGNASETIYNLTQGDTYAYQFVAQNVAGSTKGSIKTFYVPVPAGAAQ
ncbi:MAG TPA: hypothetical protein VG621_01775 [Candidatus Paceibacterota bacterium]|nr:hypothetical protein [Candidatus Paceibacterota bacterium]